MLLSSILPTFSGYVPKAEASVPASFIVYLNSSIEEEKALDGYTGLIDQTFEINLYCRNRADLIEYFTQIRQVLKAIEMTIQTHFIQEVDFDSGASETWDDDIKMNIKNISVTISYQI